MAEYTALGYKPVLCANLKVLALERRASGLQAAPWIKAPRRMGKTGIQNIGAAWPLAYGAYVPGRAAPPVNSRPPRVSHRELPSVWGSRACSLEARNAPFHNHAPLALKQPQNSGSGPSPCLGQYPPAQDSMRMAVATDASPTAPAVTSQGTGLAAACPLRSSSIPIWH